MSLITRCPACQTMFKVVPDQLRISEGWVRCGQCREIFDASQHLINDPAKANSPAPRGGGMIPSEAAASLRGPSPVPSAADVAPHPPVPPPAAPIPTAPPPPPQKPDTPDTARHYGDPAPNNAVLEPRWVEPAVADLPLPIARAGSTDSALAAPAVSPRRRPAPEDDAEEPSFLKKDDKPSFWRRPMARVLLLLLVVLLLAALAVQVLLRERDRVTSMAPAMRPVLLTLCAWVRCDSSAPRQIESVVIESSSFVRVRGDNYKLAFALRNNAAIQLAMPAIELSLTDAQDQPVIRRVILPNEFGAASRLLAGNGDWGASLSLNVRPVSNSDRIAGYRLLAFYP